MKVREGRRLTQHPGSTPSPPIYPSRADLAVVVFFAADLRTSAMWRPLWQETADGSRVNGGHDVGRDGMKRRSRRKRRGGEEE